MAATLQPGTGAMPLEDQMVVMIEKLGVKMPSELDLEGPCSECTTEFNDSGDNFEESDLPPPVPFFDRRANATASAPMLMQGVLSRARSNSPKRGALADRPRGRDFLQAKAMTVSMPNLHSSRSTHNRGIGYSVLSNKGESGVLGGKQSLTARIEEFDTLLEDL
jgi:hypothetical protein